MAPDPYPPGRSTALELIRELATRARGPRDEPRTRRQRALVLEAMTGAGKTEVLTTAAGWLVGSAPLAMVDFERCRTVDTVTALAAVVEALSRPWRAYAGLRFPRFLLGLLATDPALPAAATEDRVHAHVRAVLGSRRSASMLRSLLRDRAAPARAAVRYPDLTGRTVPWRERAAAVADLRRNHPLDWCGGIDGLVATRRTAAVAPDRYVATLCDGLLADLHDAYTNHPLADEWARTCLLLVDNADADPARGLLLALVGQRLVRLRRHPDLVDPLTVVAASRGDLLAGPVVAVTDVGPWTDPFADRVGRPEPWLRYRLPDLTAEETGDLFDAASPREHEQVRHLVHQLTGGHVGATRRVVDTWTAGHRPYDPAAAVTALHDGSVARLAADLAEHRPDTVRLAAARIADHTRWLQDGDVVTVDPAWLLSPSVAAAMWTGGPAPSLLRRLLLRRLAGDSATVAPEWTDAHRVLADFAPADDEREILHYRLASGDPDEIHRVVSALQSGIRKGEEPHWVDLVDSIALAPCPHRPGPPRTRFAAVLATYQPLDDHAAVIWRLVAGLWTLADPMTGMHRRDIHHQVAIAFGDLAATADRDGQVLRGRELHHREEAQRWE